MKARFGKDIYCQVCGKDDKITIDGTWKLDGISRKFGYKYRCNRCGVKVKEIDRSKELTVGEEK